MSACTQICLDLPEAIVICNSAMIKCVCNLVGTVINLWCQN